MLVGSPNNFGFERRQARQRHVELRNGVEQDAEAAAIFCVHAAGGEADGEVLELRWRERGHRDDDRLTPAPRCEDIILG